MIAANTAWNIVNFRGALIEGLRAEGWRVVALAADDGSAAALAALDVEFEPIQVDGSGTSRRYSRCVSFQPATTWRRSS